MSNRFEDAVEGRTRKGFGPSEAFRFDLELMLESLKAVERISSEFTPLIERERRNIVNRAVRSQYELGWASKAFGRPIYFERGYDWSDAEVLNSDGIMEHSIPVSMLVDQLLDVWLSRSATGCSQCLFACTYYVALMSPIVLISRATDRKLSEKGLHTKHPNPSLPLSRYAKVGATILNFKKEDAGDILLNDHLSAVKRTKAGSTYLADEVIRSAGAKFKPS